MKPETIARIRRFSQERDWEQFHTPANLAKSISIEAGELLECFQWSDTDYDLDHVGEELADVMVYCQNMLDAQGEAIPLDQGAVPERAVSNAPQNLHRLYGADHPARDRPLGRDTDLNKRGTKAMNIREYIDSQDESIRPRLNAVYDTIRAAIPEAEERLSWGMPTFWKGRNIIHFAPAKKHIGLYPGAEAVAFFAPRLAEYKTSKGAIQFPNSRELPLELIAEIARWSWEANRK